MLIWQLPPSTDTTHNSSSWTATRHRRLPHIVFVQPYSHFVSQVFRSIVVCCVPATPVTAINSFCIHTHSTTKMKKNENGSRISHFSLFSCDFFLYFHALTMGEWRRRTECVKTSERQTYCDACKTPRNLKNENKGRKKENKREICR